MSAVAEIRHSAIDLPAEQRESRFLWPPLILSIVLVWMMPMTTSLGMDESGNWWVLKDGFRTMLERARIWPGGQSVVFNSLVMAARSIGGDNDVVLRIPTLLSAIGAVFLLYLLGRKLFGPLVAMFSCLAFVTLRDVVYVASVLRPYSFAILLVIGAMLCLIEWLDTGKLGYAAGYVILASLTLYATFLYATMFLVHAIYCLVRFRARNSAIRPAHLLAAWAACGLLLIPLASQVLASFASRAKDTYLSVPFVETVIASVIPPLIAGAAGLAILLAFALRRPVSFSSAPFPADAWLIAVWALLPPGLVFALSLFTDIQLFAGRYFLANAPGVALAAGLILAKLEPASLRRAAAAAIAVCAFLMYGINEHFMRGLYDFRGAVAAVQEQVHDSQTPVLVIPGFVEGQSVAGILDPALAEVMLAPELRYRIPGRIVPVPNLLTGEAQEYLKRVISTTLQDKPKFLLVGLLSSEFYRTWLEGQNLGFTDRLYGNYGGVEVFVFERTSAH